MKKYYGFLFILVIVGLFLASQLESLDDFIYRPGSEYSDLTVTFWPNIYYIQQSLRAFHQYPLWRTLIFSGSPFDVDPQSGLWYPPNFIFILCPATIGFNILIFVHLVFSGTGMWFWARDNGLSSEAGILASIAYTFAPKIIAHLGFGHLGLVYGSAYVPWALWASFRIGQGQWRYIYALGFILGMQFIASPQVCFFTSLISLLYIGFTYWGYMKHYPRQVRVINLVYIFMYGGLLAGLVSAAQLLPMLRFAQLSGRQGLSMVDSAISSIPYQYLWGILLADHGGYMEYMLYAGITTLILAAMAPFHRKVLFFWGMICFSLIFSLGIHTPLFPLVYKLIPGVSWLRSPARIMIVGFALLAMLAGFGFDGLFSYLNYHYKYRVKLFLVVIGSFSLFLMIGYLIIVGKPPENLLVFGLLTPAITLFCVIAIQKHISRRYSFLIVGVLMLFDILLVDNTLIENRNKQSVLHDNGLVDFLVLKRAQGDFRVYSPSYSISRQLGALYGIESVDGVDPLYLAEYDKYMQAASGVKRHGYEVTIPAMEGGKPVAIVNQDATPNPKLLGILNVRYLLSEFPVLVDGFNFVNRFDGTYLYENEKYVKRAFFVSEVKTVENVESALSELSGSDPLRIGFVENGIAFDKTEGVSQISWLLNTPNRMILKTRNDNAGLLIISQPWYPDWRVYVNGRKEKLWKADGVMSGIYLNSGENIVELIYQPWLTYIGITISIISIVYILIKIFNRNG